MWHDYRYVRGEEVQKMIAQQIEKRIAELEALTRVLDAQIEHNESAREMTRKQIEILKQSLAENKASRMRL
jgi:hypothetical protein